MTPEIPYFQPAPTWQAVREFLTGAAPLEGVWFGEKHPTRTGMFWWRALLPVAIPAPEGADDEQAIELASALELHRALRIVDDVAALPVGGKDAVAPTSFQAGYQLACEEIAERIRTEVHVLPGGLTLPGCGQLPSVRQPADAAQPNVQPKGTASAAYRTKDGRLHVTAWECHGCGHRGIDDGADANEACSACDWRGPCPDEDVCPGCGQEGTMVSACPKCGDRYYAMADAYIAIPSPAPAPEGVYPACKGMNCGATDGKNHSPECQAEHAAAIAGGVFVKCERAEPVAWLNTKFSMAVTNVEIQRKYPGQKMEETTAFLAGELRPLYTHPAPVPCAAVTAWEGEAQRYAQNADYWRDKHTIALREWAVSRWRAEVENRPLINRHRRSLDDAWRQVIRFAGGDPDEIVGPSHDALLASSDVPVQPTGEQA